MPCRWNAAGAYSVTPLREPPELHTILPPRLRGRAATGVPHCGNCGATLPWLTECGEADFAAVVEQSSLPVMVDFWAPWCGPCRIVSPIVEKIATELHGRLELVKVNSDDAPNVSQRFGIRGIPTLVLIDYGKEVARITGTLPAPALRSWVDQHLPNAAAKPSA
jgi:thioredoxin 2